jgi:CBS domain containing-hemolysin-like protein
MTAAGHVLQPGEVVQHDGLIFHIERVERRRVIRVRLERPAPAPAETDETTAKDARAAS